MNATFSAVNHLKRIPLTGLVALLCLTSAWADPLDQWVARNSGVSALLAVVTHGNNQYVAVGLQGTILTSPNGVTWTKRAPGTTQDIYAVSYGGNQWVAVGPGGLVRTSPDAVSWTPRNSGTTANLFNVAYGNGSFVAVGNIILSSADGLTWTARTFTGALSAVTFGNGLFVAVGSQVCGFSVCPMVLTSSNGLDCVQQTVPGSDFELINVRWGNNTFVTTGSGGQLLTSPDAVNWTARTSPTTRPLYGLSFGEGLFVLVGQAGTTLTSSNGASWTVRNSGTSRDLYEVAHGSDSFVAVGDSGTILQSGTFTHSVAPSVTTQPASDLTWAGATLHGTVNPNGAATTAWFAYGLTTNYGSSTIVTNIGNGTNAVSVAMSVGNLLANTNYHFQLVATNSAGTTSASDALLQTAPSPLLPSDAIVAGNTYGEWTVRWWQWALGIPAAQNPVADTNGGFGNVGQSGPVWFLAGTFGDSVERTAIIPAGKMIFMPVHNGIFGAGVFDCDPTLPGVACDVPTLQAKAATAVTNAEIVYAWIDGSPVSNIRDYRAVSPAAFSVTFPQGAVFGIPAGTLSPHVSDGYWMMLAPLSAGSHTIQMHTVNSAGGFDSEVIHHLTVLSPGGVWPSGLPYASHTYAEWSAAWYQWALSLPATAHPLFDTADAAAGQSGPVWFLGGKFCTFPAPPGGCDASLAVRSATVPAGEALFFPIVNTEDSVIEESLGIGCGGTNEAALRSCAAAMIDGATDLACDIDGLSVSNLASYRVQSPLFQFTLAAHDDLMAAVGETGVTNGTTSQAVSDGIYVLLAPLSEGPHNLHFHGRFTCAACGNFALDITYQLTVTPPSVSLALQGTNVVLSWPRTSSGYVFEATANLSSASWTPVGAFIQALEGKYRVMLPMNAGNQFFRLRRN